MQKLKYKGYTIAFQEVPDEISLVINICGCSYKCKGCHSKYLWEYDGNYITSDIEELIDKYIDYITCVCFMGGDQNIQELCSLLTVCKKKRLKTCVYSGYNSSDKFKEIFPYINYLKIGEYLERLGGIDKDTSNQKFYKVESNELIDKTYLFRRKKI